MPRTDPPIAKSRPAYFWWALANVLAACFAVVSWMTCLYVFRNIEVPGNYELLGKIGRLPQLKPVDPARPPDGAALGPMELYRRFYGLDATESAEVNSLMLRNYLNNLSKPPLVTFVEGDYRVSEVRELAAGDFISSGLVVEAQAMVRPSESGEMAPYPVWLEVLFPAAPAAAASVVPKGGLLQLRRSPSCVVVLNAAKMKSGGEERLLITAIPTSEGEWKDTGDRGLIPIQVPETIDPRAGLPVSKNR